MTRDGSVASALPNRSSSIVQASFENTLKFTPPSLAVAPRGALAPGGAISSVVTEPGQEAASRAADDEPVRPCGPQPEPARWSIDAQRPWRAPLCRPGWRSGAVWFDRAMRILGDVWWSRCPRHSWVITRHAYHARPHGRRQADAFSSNPPRAGVCCKG